MAGARGGYFNHLVTDPSTAALLVASGQSASTFAVLNIAQAGDHIVSSSSIYGGNLPTTPWTVNGDGRGPAWNNSLFEDNAEFGLGMRLALDVQREQARTSLQRLAPHLGADLVAREGAHLLVFLSPGCGSCMRIGPLVPQWASELAPLRVRAVVQGGESSLIARSATVMRWRWRFDTSSWPP